MKSVIRTMIFFAGMAWLLSNSVPRLMTDFWHAGDFVPAQNYTITNYKCTNWNLFMFNDCTVTFVALQGRESRQITDWRFGRAPGGPVQLLQRRDDASSVTTDVSLRTLGNRLSMVLMLVLFGASAAVLLIARAFKDDDPPVGPSREEPALAPADRRTITERHARRPGFGKRHA